MKILFLFLITESIEKITFSFRIENKTGPFYSKHIENNISTIIYIGEPKVNIINKIKRISIINSR